LASASQVDRLRTDQHDGISVRTERIEGIEQNPPGDHIELIHATPPRARSSSR
jgi:hypothetical protein